MAQIYVYSQDKEKLQEVIYYANHHINISLKKESSRKNDLNNLAMQGFDTKEIIFEAYTGRMSNILQTFLPLIK